MNLLYVYFWIYEPITGCDFFFFYFDESTIMYIFGFLLLAKAGYEKCKMQKQVVIFSCL